MDYDSYFYCCSEQYVQGISPQLREELSTSIAQLPTRSTQAQINQDLWWLLTSKGWRYDSTPAGTPAAPAPDLGLTGITKAALQRNNDTQLCLTSTTLGASWRADFAKEFEGQLVQVEAQFGKVESMFKDFCGFRIARYERRLALGVEIVMCDPNKYFAHRRGAVSGMAYFDIAKKTLPAIELDCPIWLLGLRA